MKLFISSDIEGTCGICDWDETRIAHPDYYNRFADQMTREVSAACQAALGSGRIDEVLVKDAHGTARNIRFEGLPRGVKLFRGWERRPCGMMAGVEECDVAAMTGYHSFAFGEGNPLSHTNNLQNQWVKLNGQLASEFMINSYAAAYYGKPVIFVSGDEALCEHAASLIPAIETAPVLKGRGTGTVSIHPEEALELIREKMTKALSKDPAACLAVLPPYFTAEIQFRELGPAVKGAYYPGAVRVDAKTVRFESDDYFEVLRFFLFVL